MRNVLNPRARRRERERQALLQQIAEHRSELRRTVAGAIELTDRVVDQIVADLGDNSRQCRDAVSNAVRPELGTWSIEQWSNWRVDTTVNIPELRVGALVDASGQPLALPLTVALSAETGPIVVVSHDSAQRRDAIELLGSMTVRLAACFPKQIRLALLDPVGGGTAFPMSRRLERVLLGVDDVHRVLDELRSECTRIEADYLDRHHPTFDTLPETLRLGECRQVLVAAAMPTCYDDRAIEAIVELAGRGPQCGVHSIIHVDLELDPAAAALLTRLETLGATVLDLAGTTVESGGFTGTIAFDERPSGAVQEIVFQRIAAAPRRDRPVPFDALHDDTKDGWWGELSDDLIATAVGRAGADEFYDIWFGRDPETTRTCTHGIIIGAAPTGRQFVFDALLAGLGTRLSPDELRVVLVESAEHPTFAPWRSMPHTEVLALTPSPEQARAAIAELRRITERRITELERAGYSSYHDRRQDGTLPSIPRWLAIIDGYEQLFEHDTDDRAIADLHAVLSLGGRAGVHVLLGGGRFDATAPLHRAGLFDQFDLRIALQLFPDDTLGRDEFGIKGARLVQRVCDRPFRAVVNATGGHDDANLAMQLATLDPKRRDEIIHDLAVLARSERVGTRTQVLNGAEQPQLIENPVLQQLLELPRTPDALAEFARTSPLQGGLGIEDWVDEDHPLLMFVGQEETLRGQAHFVLRRRPTENALVVMADRDLRMGTVAALLVSSALVDPEDIELWISDRGAPGTPGGEALEHAVRRIARLDVPCRYTRHGDESASFIEDVAAEVARRRTLSEHEVHALPSSFLVLVEPERIPALNRLPTAQGTTDSEVGLQLRYVLMQGPAVGVHAIIAASAMAALTTVIAEPVIHHDLRHRLVTRVAEEDSFVLVRSSRAAALAAGNGHASGALLFDSHTQATTAFRPYSVQGSETGRAGPMSAQLTQLFDRLTEEIEA